MFLAHFYSIFPILGAKKSFFWQIRLCHAQHRMLKFRKNMIKFQENSRTDLTDRPYFLGLLRLPPGVQTNEV